MRPWWNVYTAGLKLAAERIPRSSRGGRTNPNLFDYHAPVMKLVYMAASKIAAKASEFESRWAHQAEVVESKYAGFRRRVDLTVIASSNLALGTKFYG